MIPHVQILEKIGDCWQYLGSTVGGGYVAKPPFSLQLYNSKTQGLSRYFIVINLLCFIDKEPLAWQDERIPVFRALLETTDPQQKNRLGPRKNADSVHSAGTHPRY